MATSPCKRNTASSWIKRRLEKEAIERQLSKEMFHMWQRTLWEGASVYGMATCWYASPLCRYVRFSVLFVEVCATLYMWAQNLLQRFIHHVRTTFTDGRPSCIVLWHSSGCWVIFIPALLRLWWTVVEGRKRRCIHIDQHVDCWDSWKHVWWILYDCYSCSLFIVIVCIV